MKINVLKPDYNRSILSISSSIMKYYNVDSKYKSLVELDKILNKEYKNVVFLILDCLGSEILKNNTSEDSFLRKNLVTDVTTIFPPTTAAATIAFHSGLSPYENGWVGWMPYFKEYDRMIELFSGKDFYTREKIIELPEKDCLRYETIYEKICKTNKDVKYNKLFPNFDGNGSDNFEQLCSNIQVACNTEGRNLISAYWTEPDHTIHYNGVYSEEVEKVLRNIDFNLEKLANNLKDTLIIISADHGAVDVKEVYLNEIDEIDRCLRKPPSIESRFVSFFVNKNMNNNFEKAIKKHFKNKCILYKKDEFFKDNLLGMGNKHVRIDDYIGDYVLICNSEINIRYSVTGEHNKTHIADHGGITKEEMLVPLIVIECDK